MKGKIKRGDIIKFVKSHTQEFYPRPITEVGVVLNTFKNSKGVDIVEVVYYHTFRFIKNEFVAENEIRKNVLLKDCYLAINLVDEEKEAFDKIIKAMKLYL